MAAVARRSGTEVVVLHAQDEVTCPGGTAARVAVVLKADWVKIFPYLNELFEPSVTAVGTPTRGNPRNPKIAHSESVLDHADGQNNSDLYFRILNTLTPLFPEAFPTSNL